MNAFEIIDRLAAREYKPGEVIKDDRGLFTFTVLTLDTFTFDTGSEIQTWRLNPAESEQANLKVLR